MAQTNIKAPLNMVAPVLDTAKVPSANDIKNGSGATTPTGDSGKFVEGATGFYTPTANVTRMSGGVPVQQAPRVASALPLGILPNQTFVLPSAQQQPSRLAQTAAASGLSGARATIGGSAAQASPALRQAPPQLMTAAARAASPVTAQRLATAARPVAATQPVTLPPQPVAATPAKPQRENPMNGFGNITRVDDAMGVGLRNAVGKAVFARGGGIIGPVTINKTFSQLVPNAPATPITLTTTLLAADQAITGSERYIYQLSLTALAFGTFPAGFTSESLVQTVLSGLTLTVQVGSVSQAIYSAQQLADTRFVQRGLDVEIYPDPGNFQSVGFVLSKTGNFPAPGPGDEYTFQADLITYWSMPGAVKL